MAMRSKAIIKWPKQVTTSLVEQLIKAERNVEKAVIVFDSASAEYTNGFRHDHNTYSLIISKLLSVNQFQRAEDFIDRMTKEECKVTEDILLSICRAYARVHKPHDVMRIFQKICDPTLKAYVTVFSILVDENQLKVAFKFYRYMRQLGFPPNLPSLNVLIKALSKNITTIDSAINIFREMPKHGCTPDTYTYGTLINGLCKLSKIKEAKELFKEMETKGCSPSIVTYTSLIHGLSQNNLDEAIALFQEMEAKTITPNVYTYSSIINGLCKNGRSLEALEILEGMIVKRHKTNMVTYSTLLHGLCKEKKIRESLEIFDRMKVQGLKPDAGLYWKMIEVFCDDGKFDKAANLLDEMVFEGIPIKRVTWGVHVKIHNTVVRGLCSRGNDGNRGFQVYCRMRGKGICVDVETFEVVVSFFCEKHYLDKAIRVFDEMVVDGCVPGEDTWSDLVCGIWGKQKVQEAADLMSKLVVFGNQI